MQDAAAFYRNRARSSFYRRRKYPVNSEDWKYAVNEAWQFIRYYRAQTDEQWPSRPADEKMHAASLLTCEKYGTNMRGVRNAIAQQELEGLTVSPETIADMKSAARGEIDTDEVRRRIHERLEKQLRR